MYRSRKRPAQSVAEYFDGHSPLARLSRRARDLGRARDALQSILPDSLHGQVQLANIDGDTLVLAVTSPAWRQRVHYLQRKLLEQISRKLDQPFRNLRFVIQPKADSNDDQPPHATRDATRETTLTVSESTARFLHSASRSIDHPGLRDTLEKISRRGDDDAESD